MTITIGLTTQELVQYCANSHDAFVRKAGERLQEAAVMAYELRAERDALQRKYDCFVGSECAGTIVKGEGYVPACRTLRADVAALRADVVMLRTLLLEMLAINDTTGPVDLPDDFVCRVNAALRSLSPNVHET